MAQTRSGAPRGMEDNLKKAVTELMLLSLLNEEDMYAGQMLREIEERSDKALKIIFPYAALYRLIDFGYIIEAVRRNAPDGRRRQFYRITDKGRAYFDELLPVYRAFIDGVQKVLDSKEKREDFPTAHHTQREDGLGE